MNASTSNTAGVHDCVNQQHGQNTSLRHLAILNIQPAGLRTYTQGATQTPGRTDLQNHYYWAHHLFVGAYSTTRRSVKTRLLDLGLGQGPFTQSQEASTDPEGPRTLTRSQ